MPGCIFCRKYISLWVFEGTEPRLSNPVFFAFCWFWVRIEPLLLYFLLLFSVFFVFTRAVSRTSRRISHDRCHLGASPDRRASDCSSKRSRRSTLSVSSRSAFEGPPSISAGTEAGEVRYCRHMGLDLRPPLFRHFLGQGGTESQGGTEFLQVTLQATSKALSDNLLFLLLASALVPLPFSLGSILCCAFESSGRRRWWA